MALVGRLSVVMGLALLAGAFGIKSRLRHAKSVVDNRTWDGNPNCIPRPGGRCFGTAWTTPASQCQPWTACSDDHYCVCHNWGCADASGTCRPQFNTWVHTWTGEVAEARIAPKTMNSQSRRRSHLTMPADGKTPPALAEGYPANDKPEALWNFLLQPDNKTLMITTKLNRHQVDPRHTAYGFFLGLPTAPMDEKELVAPIQMRPEDALSAAWHFVSRPNGRVAMQHVASLRYLCVDPEKSQIATCFWNRCGTGCEADFNLWPMLSLPTDGRPMAEFNPDIDGNYSRDDNATLALPRLGNVTDSAAHTTKAGGNTAKVALKTDK